MEYKSKIDRGLSNKKLGGLGLLLAKELSKEFEYEYKNGENIIIIGL